MTEHTALDGATIAFDLDGTLVETAPDLIGAVNAVLIAEGFPPVDYTQGRTFISRGARWLLQWGLTSGAIEDPADFGYTEISAAELAPDTLLHHFDDLVDACVGLLNGVRASTAA
ncbi:MAG: hypothetical protein JOY84_13930 [Curvibacter sp.]|nr:hypothetical protein [Curvibacter sp.]